MAGDLTPTATANKNALTSAEPWYWLYEIEVPTDPATRYRWVNSPDNDFGENGQIEFGVDGSGNPLVYSPFPVTHGESKEDANADLDDVTLTIGNPSREVVAKLDAHDMVGQPVRILLVNRADLLSGIATRIDEYEILGGITVTARAITARIGRYSLLRRSFPGELAMRDHCGFLYRGDRCGYTGAITTCDKTLSGSNGCEAHSNETRFGGHPSMPLP